MPSLGALVTSMTSSPLLAASGAIVLATPALLLI